MRMPGGLHVGLLANPQQLERSHPFFVHRQTPDGKGVACCLYPGWITNDSVSVVYSTNHAVRNINP